MPVHLDLPPAWKRTPYAESVVFIGVDWRASDLKMELRNLPGDTGDPLVALMRTSSGQGLGTMFYPAYPIPGTALTAPATEVFVRMNETTLEELMPATPTFAPLSPHYDLHVGNGVEKRVAMFGVLPINPGVTL